MKLKLFITLSIAFVIGAMQIEYFFRRSAKMRRIAGIAGTQAKMALIAYSIQGSGLQHPVGNEQMTDWLDSHGIYYAIDENNNFLDEWDMPISIHYEESAIYKFVSFGPNRQDNHGKGDDIVRVFDLSNNEIIMIE